MSTNIEWGQPATTWPELIKRYAAYLATPRWRGRALMRDGSEARECITTKQAARLEASLSAAVVPLIDSGVLARTVATSDIKNVAARLNYSGGRFDRCPKRLWHLWRAVIFNRDRYTCRYCGRSTWEVEAMRGRGLRFELDHSTARARLGEDCDDFDGANIVTACRSCNVLKARWTILVSKWNCDHSRMLFVASIHSNVTPQCNPERLDESRERHVLHNVEFGDRAPKSELTKLMHCSQ